MTAITVQPVAAQPALPPTPDELAGVLRDYTQVAERLGRTHEALQGEIARLRQELAVKDRELQLRRRLSSLGELVAGVAHEVRNPLGAIQLYSDLLRRQCREQNFDYGLRLIDKIEAGIQAIDAVVEDTLALAPRDRQLQGCPLGATLGRARDAAQRVLVARGVTLELPELDEALAVLADESGLQRVLVNLIVNAAEASEPGQSVRVEVSPAAGEMLTIHVRDPGAGIPDAVMERIFEPFFTTKPCGTGLGLTIAHRLVEAFGGRLSAANRPAGGAELTVTLRRATPDASAQPAARPAAADVA